MNYTLPSERWSGNLIIWKGTSWVKTIWSMTIIFRRTARFLQRNSTSWRQTPTNPHDWWWWWIWFYFRMQPYAMTERVATPHAAANIHDNYAWLRRFSGPVWKHDWTRARGRRVTLHAFTELRMTKYPASLHSNTSWGKTTHKCRPFLALCNLCTAIPPARHNRCFGRMKSASNHQILARIIIDVVALNACLHK